MLGVIGDNLKDQEKCVIRVKRLCVLYNLILGDYKQYGYGVIGERCYEL